MENNRTPGIWQYEKNLNHSIFVQTANKSNKGKVYITGYTSGEANAKFICKAANEYDRLKEENTLLIEALGDMVNSYEKSRGLLMITYLHPEYSKAKELLNNIQK